MSMDRIPNVLIHYEHGVFKVTSMEPDSFLKTASGSDSGSGVSVFSIVDACINGDCFTIRNVSFYKVVNIDELPEKAKKQILDEDQGFVNSLMKRCSLEEIRHI